ncbi:pyridoxine 5'-phosphate synthase [uncultured Algimonas sp.]|uniref:pyridoxine 5'-phosphate synthase n=1 Tax=uncultured Algimonas sp. TaxID=1547920 RepID=UPI00261F97B6|nr:pyridoxine 5'-phosphate synthase [uncultured Algimonas sp.]
MTPVHDKPVRLGVNIDHVATLRNARGGTHPDPVDAAMAAIEAGADGITAHLREDRRHITDGDMDRLAALCEDRDVPLNMELAATEEMVEIAARLKPHAACLVPERREERTTEGGLDVAGQHNRLVPAIARLADAGCRVSLFIEAAPHQIDAAASTRAEVVEFHTGAYAHALDDGNEDKAQAILEQLRDGGRSADAAGLEVHYGHGLTFDNVRPVAAIPEARELNIGHFIIGEAVFLGLGPAIRRMADIIADARAAA